MITVHHNDPSASKLALLVLLPTHHRRSAKPPHAFSARGSRLRPPRRKQAESPPNPPSRQDLGCYKSPGLRQPGEPRHGGSVIANSPRDPLVANNDPLYVMAQSYTFQQIPAKDRGCPGPMRFAAQRRHGVGRSALPQRTTPELRPRGAAAGAQLPHRRVALRPWRHFLHHDPGQRVQPAATRWQQDEPSEDQASDEAAHAHPDEPPVARTFKPQSHGRPSKRARARLQLLRARPRRAPVSAAATRNATFSRKPCSSRRCAAAARDSRQTCCTNVPCTSPRVR